MRCTALASILLLAGFAPADEETRLAINLPLQRMAYQTNEAIELAVVRSSKAALPAGELKLTATTEEGSRLAFAFPVAAAAPEGAEARATEHLRLNGWLLRPGRYTLEASLQGATAKKEIEVLSHVRQSSFRIIDWSSRAKGAEQAAMGAESLGFNLLFASYGGLSPDDSIRAGLDYMWCCTMGGGHQMDLRMECDWSDPYVLQGGTARVVRQAFKDRTRPNAVGVHFYDEPGLTWWKHPKTGEMTPHDIPAQHRAFKSAFARDPLAHTDVRADNPDHVARWEHWGRWKLSFMDAAWKQSSWGVSRVRPEFTSVTQSVYGWSAYTDGYYFNVARSMPVMSGHGGYDDYGGGYYNPLYTFEMGRMRELRKPNWYLPTWYGNIPSDRYRLEQYSSFIYNLQGMCKPPDIQIHRPSSTAAADGVLETNKLMARLGTIFTTAPVTRPPAAVLYSMSQNLAAQTRNMGDNYEGGGHGRDAVYLVYLAGLRLHTPILPVVEEDVIDGTLAAHHKAIILTQIERLEPKVVAGLEAFAAGGGTVLTADDCKVAIKGATPLGGSVDQGFFQEMSRLWREKKQDEHAKLNRAGNYLKAAEPVAQLLKPKLESAGIKPVYECDNPEIIASRQALGEIEYLFAVNASYDAAAGGMNSIKPAAATVKIPGTVYDAVLGGTATPGALRFGPGQMRAWARTPRPIGSVQALPPFVHHDTTLAREPLRVEIGAALLDANRRILAGSAPLQIRLIDPLGGVRYDLYRATERGTLRMTLPLAANDPAGEWKVVVRDLLANTEDVAKFNYAPPSSCGALAGSVGRAVAFGEDRENVFRFFRTFQDVTVVVGKGEANAGAAERLAEILKPWGVRAKTMPLAEAARPRAIAPEEASTWSGMQHGKVVPGDKNSPHLVGFAVQGPVILVGTPDDHPILKFAADQGFLPYAPHKTDFPGRGRGMVAWQRDAVGMGQESVALIAFDAAGTSEAIGSMYEMATALDPLLPLVPPTQAAVVPANKAFAKVPEAGTAWHLALPDRAAGVIALSDRALVLTEDGSLTSLDAQGKIEWQNVIEGGETWAFDASEKLIAVGASHQLVAFDRSGRRLFAAPLRSVTCVAVAPDGSAVAAGTSDGKLTLFGADGKTRASLGGTGDPKNPKPYLSAIFSNDGKTLLAMNGGEAHVIADGKIASKIGYVSGRVKPVRVKDQILLSDGNEKAQWFSPADGKITSQIPLGKAGIISLAAGAAGTEMDGGVRGFKDGKVAWEHKVPQRLTKLVAAREDLVAAAFWGGTLRILDGSGALKSAQAFPQDIAGLAWLGDRLVVALADGRLMALDAK